jgi:hypothetical protein
MKIIGITDSSNELICTISKDEIANVFNLCSRYSLKEKMELASKLIVGGEVDLTQGYRFRDEIKKVCEEMIKTVKLFNDAQQTLLRFAELAAKDE